jgi:hypothetical protein
METTIKFYGFVYNLADMPSDNFYTKDNELTLQDNSVVYGYEGYTQITAPQGLSFELPEYKEWLSENLSE